MGEFGFSEEGTVGPGFRDTRVGRSVSRHRDYTRRQLTRDQRRRIRKRQRQAKKRGRRK